MNEMIHVCLDQISVVCMVVCRSGSKEVYAGSLAVCLYNGVYIFLYVG